MQYKRYLLAGMVLLMLVLLIMFAELMSGPATAHIHPEDISFLKVDSPFKAVLIGLPPLAIGIYILMRHKLKNDNKAK